MTCSFFKTKPLWVLLYVFQQINSTPTFGLSSESGATAIDPAPVLSAVIADVRAGVRIGVIGARFHHAVAELAVDLAVAGAGLSRTVALSGGVFQNALLLGLVVPGLRAKGFDVITHRRVPPNDGGIALGQLLVGNAV